ncbi:MAG: Smr/MutS family protein, partial [Lentisphaeria bacterium]
EGSTFILCNNILADIGDSQSIVHNLSTFSAHLSKIKDFLATLSNHKRKNPRSLILIDEIGSGTDPLEGGALACAILEKLSSLATLTVASTHLGTVKTYVSDSNHMINAAMLFNTDTFTPEFKLHIGRPGASHALNLARKMALPFDVLDNAEKMMDSDQLRLESMLATLEEDQRNFYRDAEKLQRDKQETLSAKQKVTTQLDELRRERKQIMHDAYREAALMIQNTRKQMKSIVAKVKESATISLETNALLKQKEEKVSKAMANTEAKPTAPITADRLKPNMTVWVEKLQSRAKIISITSHDKVRIDLNGLPFEVPIKQIGRIINDIHPENRSKVIPTSKPRASKASFEINLLGLRVHQAMNQLERAIDQAMLANLHEIKVIHGFGSGALRSNIHEYLNRMNISFRDGEYDKGEGGAAATIITL